MKKFGLIIAAFALVLGLSQCTKQRPEMPHYSGQVGDMYIQHINFKATQGNNNNRSTPEQDGGQMKFKWEAKDHIYVSDGTRFCGKLTYSGTPGDEEGTFDGDIAVTGTPDNLYFFYLGTADYTLDQLNADGGVPFSLKNQDGTLTGDNGIKKLMIAKSNPVTFIGAEESYNANLNLQFSIAMFDLTSLGVGNVYLRGYSSNGFVLTKDGNLTKDNDAEQMSIGTAQNPAYIALVTEANKGVEYTFTGTSKVGTKTISFGSESAFFTVSGTGAAGTFDTEKEIVKAQSSDLGSKITDPNNSGKVILLTENATLNCYNAITPASGVTLDLGGNTVTLTNKGEDAFKVESKNNVTFQNGTFEVPSGAYNSDVFYVKSSTGVVFDNVEITSGSVPVWAGGGSNVTIKGNSKFTATGTKPGSGDPNEAYGAAIAMSGGTSVVNVEGGEFTGTYFAASIFSSGGTLNIKGGTFHKGTNPVTTSPQPSECSLLNDTNGNQDGIINISGSAIIEGNICGKFAGYIAQYTAYLNITGGTFVKNPFYAYNFRTGKITAPGYTSTMTSGNENTNIWTITK